MPDYLDRIRELFNHRGEYSRVHNIHLINPNQLDTLDRIAQHDRWTADYISRLTEELENLTAYRRALADRYNELSTMPYALRLTCKRHRSYRDNKVRYTIKLTRHYQDGTENDELMETYPGTERRTALARYTELQKTHPGINCELDIEKASWER